MESKDYCGLTFFVTLLLSCTNYTSNRMYILSSVIKKIHGTLHQLAARAFPYVILVLISFAQVPLNKAHVDVQ